MLHYPRLKIPEERFAWIYPLSTELEPIADIYWWECQQQDTKDTWSARLEGKELQKYGEWAELEKLCLPLLKQYPRVNCFFFFSARCLFDEGRFGIRRAIKREKKAVDDFIPV